MERGGIYAEIEKERAYQTKHWQQDDAANTPWMWVSYIGQYATKWMAGTFLPLDKSITDNFRTAMVKVAALAVAAIESVDRQRNTKGKTFYES